MEIIGAQDPAMETIGTVALLTLLITIVLSLIWRSAFLKRAKLQHAHDDRYLKLAERSEEQQAKVGEQLQALNARVASIEETLKVVE